MELENRIQQKRYIIKIKSETTEESVLKQLKDITSEQEFKLSIKNCVLSNIIFNNLYNTLQNTKNITNQTWKFHKVLGLQLDLIFNQQYDFSHIVSLSLQINHNIFVVSNSEFTLGKNISKLVNLESLSINLNFNDSSQYFEYVKLNEAYIELKKLKSLNIIIQNPKQNTYEFSNFIEGIHHLIELECLNIQSIIIINKDFYLLAEELQYLSNLQEFSLKTEQFAKFQEFNIEKFCKSLKTLKKLCKLSLNAKQLISNSSKDQLIEAFQSLNLSFLSYDTINQSCDLQPKYFSNIQQLSDVKEIQLCIFNLGYFMTESQFYQELSNTKNITSLFLQFYFCEKDFLLDIFYLMCYNEAFNCLKSLNIQIDHLNKRLYNNIPYIFHTQNETILYLANLEKFSIDIKYSFDEIQDLYEHLHTILSQLPKLSEIISTIGDIQKLKKEESIKINSFTNNKPNLRNLKLPLDKSKYLILDNCNQFLKELQSSNQLSKLNLFLKENKNILEDDICVILCQSLEQLIKIQDLNLNFEGKKLIFKDMINKLSQTLLSLKSLKYLTLKFAECCMENGCFEELLKCISNLINLKTLSLFVEKKNYIIKISKLLSNIFIFPINLKTLKINLKDNNFKYIHIKGFFQQISQMKNLEVLKINIYSIQLKNNEVVEIRNQLCSLKSISKLSLNFQEINSIYLINLFDDLPFLKELNLLKSNLFMKRKVYAIKKFTKMENLQQQYEQNQIEFHENKQQISSIDLKQLEFESDIFLNLEIIPQKFYKHADQMIWCFQNTKNISSLKLLISKNCQIGEKNTIIIFQTLQYLTQLKELEIFIEKNNKINTQSIIELGNQLQKFRQLQTLSISIYACNQVTWQEGIKIFKTLSNLNKLIKLKILIQAADDIVIDKSRDILENIGCLTNLQNLDLSIQYSRQRVYIDSKNVNVVDFFINMKNLQMLKIDLKSLNHCEKRDEKRKQFYENLKKLPNLNYVVLINFSSLYQLLFKLKRLVQYMFL